MSDFKFACPVCGQHITADSHASGSQLECPTCFQKIVVPQAPASADAKFILSASQVSKPRPVGTDTVAVSLPVRRPLAARLAPMVAGLVLVALAASAAVVAFKKQLFKSRTTPVSAPTNATPAVVRTAPRSLNPIPTNVSWTIDLASASIPETVPVGSLHGSGFRCERVILQGGNLSFRQGKTWPPDLGLTILLFAKRPEELSGKNVEVTADRSPPLPQLILRWKDDQQQPAKEEFQRGYALKLAFGSIANDRLPGQVFVSLPDQNKSFLAGTFAAEIRRPPPTKSKKGPPKPMPPAPKQP